MFFRIVLLLFLGSGSLLMSACKNDFVVDVFSSDLFADENLVTPAIMKVQIPSCDSDDRAEYERQVLGLFESISRAKITGCEDEGMNSMLIVSFSAELVSETSDRDVILVRESLGDVEHENVSYETKAIRPVIKDSFLQRIELLLQENYQSLSYDDVKIELVINNDEKNEIMASAFNVWVDGNPIENYYRQKIRRRQKVTVLFSNVVSDLILQGKRPLTVLVYRPK
jgi:hypothetical protein